MSAEFNLSEIRKIIDSAFPDFRTEVMKSGIKITSDKLNSINDNIQFYVLSVPYVPVMIIDDDGWYLDERNNMDLKVNNIKGVNLEDYDVKLFDDDLVSVVDRTDIDKIISGVKKYSELMNKLFIVKE